MSNSLNDLFDQILQTEKVAQVRKNQISEVKDEIISTHAQITEKREELQQLRNQQPFKIHQLMKANQDLKCAQNRLLILREKLSDNEAHRTELLQTQKESQIREIQIQESFCDKAREFSQLYCLGGSRKDRRHYVAATKLESLKKQRQQLEQELKSMEDHNELLQSKRSERTALRSVLDEKKTTITEIRKAIEETQKRLNKKQEEKSATAKMLQSDVEYKRLQEDYESSKDDTLEDLCSALQKQLQELKQKKWQASVRQKRKAPEPKKVEVNPQDGSEVVKRLDTRKRDRVNVKVMKNY